MERNFSLRIRKLIGFLGFLFISCSLSGCIDLGVSRTGMAERKQVNAEKKFNPTKKQSAKKAEVYTMRGGLGLFSKGMNHLEDKLRNREIYAESTIWYKSRQLSREIIARYQAKQLQGPIILAGHSLGANEQIKVAARLAKAHIPVDLLITVDAVSPNQVPPNVRHVVNLYKPAFMPMLSGLKLRAIDPEFTYVENINVATFDDIDVNHFTIDKHKTVQNIMVKSIVATIKNSNKEHS